MSWRVRYTRAAREDLLRLYSFLLEHDVEAARRTLGPSTTTGSYSSRSRSPAARPDPDDPFLRELLVSFVGAFGYVALDEIERDQTVTILAVRHQREDDYP